MATGLQLSLGEFVKQLALKMNEAHLEMPFKEETPWHLLFYRLKKECKFEGRPEFLDHLRFDWDGPSPKCQELSDFIQALHWTGSVIAVNPSYEKIMVEEDVAALWSRKGMLDSTSEAFLGRALALAQEEFRE
jgi:hypothetical protein